MANKVYLIETHGSYGLDSELNPVAFKTIEQAVEFVNNNYVSKGYGMFEHNKWCKSFDGRYEYAKIITLDLV